MEHGDDALRAAGLIQIVVHDGDLHEATSMRSTRLGTPASIASREKRVARVVGAAARERGDARRIAAQCVERLAERARVAGRNEHTGLAVDTTSGTPPARVATTGRPAQHRLDEHATERLGQHRRVHDDVARGEQPRHVVARAEHVDAARERRAARRAREARPRTAPRR